jgi:hypothetical protein
MREERVSLVDAVFNGCFVVAMGRRYLVESGVGLDRLIDIDWVR